MDETIACQFLFINHSEAQYVTTLQTLIAFH